MKKLLYAVLVATVVIISCTKEDVVLPTLSTTKVPSVSYEISESQAKKNLLNYLGKLEKASTKSIQSDIQIGSSEIIKIPYTGKRNTRSVKNNIDINIYNFTLSSPEGKGYALVSGDIRIPQILIFCEQGTLQDTIFNKGLAKYVENTFQNLSNFIDEWEANYAVASTRVAPGRPNLPEQQLLDTISIKDSIGGDTLYREIGILSYSFNELKEVFVPVQWGQGAPYNNNVPMTCNSGKAPAGCVAIAMAQIMAYHKYPPTYNWDLLTSKKQIDTYSSEDATRRIEVARLIADIGSKVHMRYDCYGSGSNIYDANAAFTGYGYKTCGVAPFSIYHEIPGEYGRYHKVYHFNSPIYLRGVNDDDEGHAFVADGRATYIQALWIVQDKYYRGQYVTTDLIFAMPITWGDVGLYLHINWGWYGSSNGWYIFANLSKNDINDFYRDMKVIYDITPNK